MKIPEIKRLVENHSLNELQAAENALMEQQVLAIEVKGDDEGEQLTHILAGIEILTNVEKENIPVAKALRNYTQRVRNSIS